MDTWFNTPERIALLNEVAASWVGTPFVANSRCKGKRGGVSCQMLAEQIYKECGCPLPFGAEKGSMRWAGVSKDSLILKYLEDKTEFLHYVASPSVGDLIAGDLMGFRIGGCIHHVGVCLGNGLFIHCMRGSSTLVCSVSDPTFARRLGCLWRVKP